MSKKKTQDPSAPALAVANALLNAQLRDLRAQQSELHRVKAVTASAYQVVELAMAEPENSRIAKHLVHCAALALSSIED